MRKKLIWAMLVIPLLLVSMAMVNVAVAHPTKIYVDMNPATMAVAEPDLGPLSVGDTFTVGIWVDYVYDLWLYQFHLTFNPRVIHGVSVVNGPFMWKAGGTMLIDVLEGSGFDNDKGELGLFGAAFKSLTVTATGSSASYGPLALVTFEVVGGGLTEIMLGEQTGILDDEGNWTIIGREYVEDGLCYTHEPYADFVWLEDEPQPGPGTVTFDASGSFDPDNYPAKGPILSYSWDFGDGGTAVTTDAIIEHDYAEYDFDPYMVALTVSDEEAETSSYEKPLRMWRDLTLTGFVYLPDVIHGTEVRIIVISENLGTVTETFTATLLADGLSLGTIEGTISPGEELPLSFMFDTAPLTECGLYTLTAEIETAVDLDDTNNMIQTTIYVHALVEPRSENVIRKFSIHAHGTTFYFYGKVKNVENSYTAIDGVWARLVFEVVSPGGLPRIYKTEAAYVENRDISPQLTTMWEGLTEEDVGTYVVTTYAEIGWEGPEGSFPLKGLERRTFSFTIA